MDEPVYLDGNATVRPLPEVVDAIADAMRSAVGNPSSAHSMGAEARAMLEDARDSVCKLIPALLPEGIIFTSGGTEANNAVILSFGGVPGLTVVMTAAEHPSVLAPDLVLARVPSPERARAVEETRVVGDGTWFPRVPHHLARTGGSAPARAGKEPRRRQAFSSSTKAKTKAPVAMIQGHCARPTAAVSNRIWNGAL